MDFLHASVTGLVQVFAWPTFGLMLLGMALGFVVAAFAFVYGLFEKALSVPFPPGQLFVWLGYGG